jgi:hypothetical protein
MAFESLRVLQSHYPLDVYKSISKGNTMSDRTYAKVQAQQKTLSESSPKSDLLQRTCACGQHTIAGGECSACSNQRSMLLRSQRAFGSPSSLATAQNNASTQENVSSLNSVVDSASHFGHDFSQIPVYSSHPLMLQTKLTVNQPRDVYEQEADQVAEQVMRMTDLGPSASNDESEAKTPLIVHTVLNSGGGQPLDPATRAFMEPRFGHDFSQVRVHTGGEAANAAHVVQARAYTIGHDIVFGSGEYTPVTVEGTRLLAHELVHVVQQSANALPLTQSVTAVQCQGRGERGVEEGREEGREVRTGRAHDDDYRRGRPEGGRSRNRRHGLLADFESDWAGRAILERYLGGEGDWDIRNNPLWTEYMKRSDLLRGQLHTQVIVAAREAEAFHHDGTFPVNKTFHAEVENGEGIVGYQYLHGTNKDVGDFQIAGNAKTEHVYGESRLDILASIEPGATVEMQLQFVWNDKIDPNPEYGSDTVKSIIAEIITFGEAESYRISIGWTDKCTAWIPEVGIPKIFGYPDD